MPGSRARTPARSERAAALLIALAVALFGACRAAGNPTPPPARTVDGFFSAWSSLQASEMAAHFGNERRGSGRFLQRWLERTLARGAITGFSVRRTDAISTDDRGSELAARAPYSVTYVSRAAARPVTLSGELTFVFDRQEQRWTAAWNRAAMWPGVGNAAGFDVVYRRQPRARIVDRTGATLARGSGERRIYPFGAVGGTVVGHLERPTDDRARRSGHEIGDLVGASGLEEAFDARLAGRPSARLVVVGGSGRVVRGLGRRPGRPSGPVRTTLDIRIQRAVEEGFGATVGGVAVLRVGSGDLLAAASSSRMDPNAYVGADANPFNRALSGLYPPGSAMKVVAASAALDAGIVTPESSLSGPREYKGVRNFESGSFGTIDFASALKLSVNTVFAQVAERLGAGRLTRVARAFGFGRAPEMALDAARSSWPRPEDGSDLMWASIGQAQVLATPLQMATVAATIAQRGRRMEPRAAFAEQPRGTRAISRRTADTMTRLMQEVVEEGTGVGARIPNVSVAGKTGTAEVDVEGQRKNHAWFICFAPAQAPEVAVAVVAELGGIGGEVAAPLAARILQRVLPLVR